MEKQKVVIIGAGGHAREVLDLIEAINQDTPTFEMLGFVVEPGYEQPGAVINDQPVLGHFNWLEEHRGEVKAAVGIGFPAPRFRVVKKLNSIGVEFVNLIHPQALLTRWITLGSGVIITAGCILTNQITLGDHVHINRMSNVGHDNLLEDFATVSPGVNLSGSVTLRQGCFIGTGASIIESKSVGAWARVGAGGTVVSDIPDNTTAVGVPAEVVATRPDGWHLDA